jgi:hypothetical protein
MAVVLIVIIGFFSASLTLFSQIGQEFFPAVDAGQISIQVRAPSNLRLDATERRIIDVERIIAETIPQHELQMVVSEIGLNNDWSAAYSQNAGQQDTVIRLQLSPERTYSAQEYAILLRQAFHKEADFSDLEFSFDTGGMVAAALNFGAASPIDIQITGGAPEQKIELAKKVQTLVRNVEGAADVRTLQRNDGVNHSDTFRELQRVTCNGARAPYRLRHFIRRNFIRRESDNGVVEPVVEVGSVVGRVAHLVFPLLSPSAGNCLSFWITGASTASRSITIAPAFDLSPARKGPRSLSVTALAVHSPLTETPSSPSAGSDDRRS